MSDQSCPTPVIMRKQHPLNGEAIDNQTSQQYGLRRLFGKNPRKKPSVLNTEPATYAGSSPPIDNINICFVGGVSTGKSTILNAIFCEELTQCKIKRTTMVPTVYVENENGSDNLDDTEDIFKIISEKNKEIIDKTEAGNSIDESDYNELIFNVGKLDINILPDSFVNVYDIPGLNDARTKNIYYKYLEENFIKFNLLIFIVDIHSGLNTSDENDILNFIVTHTKEQLIKNNKKIYTLVVVNKADDMQLVEDSANDELELTGELNEMMDQVKKTISREFVENEITNHLVGIIPLCAIDSYLYRMVKKHGNNFKLSPEQILKIGINENGKKFSTLKPSTQEEKVKAILNDAEFIKTMITLSGFGHFENLLHSFLDNNDTGKCIRINNLLFEQRKLPALLESINNYETNSLKLKEAFESHFKILNIIKEIDYNVYYDIYVTIYVEIDTTLIDIIDKLTSLSDAIIYYDEFKSNILMNYFADMIDTDIYSSSVQEFVVKKITHLFRNENLSMPLILNNIMICSKVGILNKPILESMFTSIIENIYGYECLYSYDSLDTDEEFISLLESVKHLQVNTMYIIRFILLARIHVSLYSKPEMIQKQMIYLSWGEVPIYSRLININAGYRFDNKHFLEGINPSILSQTCHRLDLYYLTNFSK